MTACANRPAQGVTMPFVALFNGVRVDTTRVDDVRVDGDSSPALGLSAGLPACLTPVRGNERLSTLTRWVSHVRSQPDCASNGESPDHRRLKVAVVEALRGAGWNAELEVSGPGWRADVLGIAPPRTPPRGESPSKFDGSAQSDLETAERTRRLEASGCEVVWLTRRLTTWFRQSPSWQIRSSPSATASWTESGVGMQRRSS